MMQHNKRRPRKNSDPTKKESQMTTSTTWARKEQWTTRQDEKRTCQTDVPRTNGVDPEAAPTSGKITEDKMQAQPVKSIDTSGKRKAEEGSLRRDAETSDSRHKNEEAGEEGTGGQREAINKPLTEEEIQNFIEMLPTKTQKRKHASETDQSKVGQRQAAEGNTVNRKVDKDRKLEGEKKHKDIAVDENMYFTEEQIQAFIRNMGRTGKGGVGEGSQHGNTADREEQGGYAQIGGSSSSGGNKRTGNDNA